MIKMSCKWCDQYSSKQGRRRTKLRRMVLANCKCGDEKNDK
tara:strand:+ start:7328 stop:7450 length:123 start_codon:yes stop_codon:yes gene_type:complete